MLIRRGYRCRNGTRLLLLAVRRSGWWTNATDLLPKFHLTGRRLQPFVASRSIDRSDPLRSCRRSSIVYRTGFGGIERRRRSHGTTGRRTQLGDGRRNVGRIVLMAEIFIVDDWRIRR